MNFDGKGQYYGGFNSKLKHTKATIADVFIYK